MAGEHLLSSGVLAQELTESEATRRVFLTAGGLALIGAALLVATVWWWRSTRPEHPVLGPLETMSDRRWRRATTDERQRMIGESRPPASAAAEPDAQAVVVTDAPDGARAGAAVSEAVGARVPAPVVASVPDSAELSALVASAPPSDVDLAEIDRLLGIAPDAPAEAPVEPEAGAGDEAVPADPQLQRTSAVAKD
jgi:hypothetical protein